jgi:hypothetical protein
MKFTYIIWPVFIALTSSTLFAQFGHGGKPLSFDMELFDKGSLKSGPIMGQMLLAPIDNDKEIQKTDSINYFSNAKVGFYGKVISTDIDLTADVEPIEMEGGRLWLYHIFSATAHGLQVYFDDFILPKGGRLYVYNEAKDLILGAFTEQNNNTKRHFGTQFLPGNSVIIEYFEPDGAEGQSRLHIDKVIHVFKPIFDLKSSWGNSKICYTDITCETDPLWKQTGASVALILAIAKKLSYTYFCSGSLLNNALNDKTPYFLSAAHCADTNWQVFLGGYDTATVDISSWIFLFNYEYAQCAENYTADAGKTTRVEPRILNHSVYGADLLSVDINPSQPEDTLKDFFYTDHLLLKLNATAEELAAYHVGFSGWDIRDDAALFSTYVKSIHHPRGNPKSVSTGGMVYSSSMSLWPDIHWATEWFDGATSKGSSGSPLFNDQLKVIGHLHGGSSSCSNPSGTDYFNKFSLSYTLGGFQKWLDPNGSNILTLNSLHQPETDYRQEDFKITREPGSDIFRLTILEPINPYSLVNLEIYNAVGQQVHHSRFDGANIIHFNFTVKNPGIYIFRLDYNFKTHSRKKILTQSE